jgi:hypothetical protein
MKSGTFTSFDIGIIILIVTLVCGFLIYMILRLMEIFSSSKELQKEKEKFDIEILKVERDLIKKAKEKKGSLDTTSTEIKKDQKHETTSTPSDEKNNPDSKEEIPQKDNKDDFSDIQNENIVQF